MFGKRPEVLQKMRWNGTIFRILAVMNFIMALILSVAACSGNVQAAQKENIPCMVGYSEKTLPDVESRDIEAAFKLWSKELAAQHGFYIETILYSSTDKLIADFLAKKLDFAGMTSIEFLRSEKTLKVKPELTQYRNDKSFVKFLALVRADDAKKGLAGLKNKRLSILRSNDLGMMFLDTQLMKSGFRPCSSFFSEVSQRSKESQAIFDVFFGKAEICLVTDRVFYTLAEMNPQVARRLQVIAESPELVSSIGFFRPDWPLDYKQKAIEVLKSDVLKHHERGRQITLLFHIERIDAIENDQLENIRKLLADYERLKKRM